MDGGGRWPAFRSRIRQPPTGNAGGAISAFGDGWQEAAAHHSSSTVRNSHPAYREIISLGQDVVPLLLRDLEDNQTHWFCALREITGADPIPTAAAGDIPRMVQAWLDWAQHNSYRW